MTLEEYKNELQAEKWKQMIDKTLCPLLNNRSCKCKTCHTGLDSTNPRNCKYCLKRRSKKYK